MSDVLIAEDDLTIADMLQDILEQAGYTVTAVARTVDEAMRAADRHMPDFAVIDLHLANGGMGSDIAAYLRRQAKVGIIFSTGADHQVFAPDLADAVMLKPYRLSDVVHGLHIISDIAARGRSDVKWPVSFRLLADVAACV
jgi:DNA-binding response OmpR family regulator